MTLEIIICRGIPASGKSFFARKWITDQPNRAMVGRDDIRFSVFGKYSGLTFEQEEIISRIEKTTTENLLRAGQSVILHSMHLRPKYISEWRKWLYGTGIDAEIQIKEFYIDLDTAIERDAKREKSVGEEVLRMIWNKYTRKGQFLPDPGWSPAASVLTDQPYIPPVDAPTAIIVDLDGTLAGKTSTRGYHDYHRVSEDTPREHIVEVVLSLADAGHKIIFLSGRPDSCREATYQWLIKHVGLLAEESPLFMRKEGDYRKDYIIKSEIFDAEIRDKYKVLMALDDRPQILRYWDSIGVPALDAAPLSGEF